MKKKYKIKLPKGKKVTMTNVDFENGVMTVNVELENKEEPISEAEKVIKHLRSIDWDKRTKESVDRIRDELYHKKHPKTISNYERWESKFGDINEQKYEPKDGDFVYVKAGYEHIAIFKKEAGDNMYVYANWNMSFSISKIIIDDSKPLCCIQDIRDIRPATEREKKILIDQLAKVDKKWNPKTKRIEDVRWRAKKSNPYYYIIGFDTIVGTTDERLAMDDSRHLANNYFKTREAAEKVAEQIRNIFKSSKEE